MGLAGEVKRGLEVKQGEAYSGGEKSRDEEGRGLEV